MKSDKDSWLKEYTEFVQLDSSGIPNEIFNKIKNRLFPNPWKVFGKILAIHSIVGFLSLAICSVWFEPIWDQSFFDGLVYAGWWS